MTPGGFKLSATLVFLIHGRIDDYVAPPHTYSNFEEQDYGF